MGRLLVLLATVLALAVPTGLLAAGTDGTMSVKRGRALIVFDKLQGTVIGRMASGKVRISALGPGRRGCEHGRLQTQAAHDHRSK